jgi:uncharacterized protein YndB with AHSA1/START domain
MDTTQTSSATAVTDSTTTERTSDRELVVTRTFNGPAHLVFKAWTTPDLLMRWWAPGSFGINLVGCEVDARTGGSYRFDFAVPDAADPVSFFGTYLEVTPPSRIVWTNEEADGGSITTVTLEEKDGRTHLVLHDLYPSKDALDAALASGSTGAYPEQFDQLELVLAIAA